MENSAASLVDLCVFIQWIFQDVSQHLVWAYSLFHLIPGELIQKMTLTVLNCQQFVKTYILSMSHVFKHNVRDEIIMLFYAFLQKTSSI